MRTEFIKLYEGREDVTLTSYILADSAELLGGKTRPAILICPGGGYLNCSDREAEPVALRFAAMGYHAFVLRYSTYMEERGTVPDMNSIEVKAHCVHPNPMRDIGKAMLVIREHAKDWLVDEDRIAICGFSAGAHNCAMYATNWNKPVITDFFGKEKELFRPAVAILGYPLIDYCYKKELEQETEQKEPLTERFSAMTSIAFLGTQTPSDDLLREVSPLLHVSAETPPTFIWSTVADELVPIQHSIRMAHALADKGIPFEVHIFEEGSHGLSLADQTTASAESQIDTAAQEWIKLAEKWLKKRFAYELPEYTELETMMQQGQVI